MKRLLLLWALICSYTVFGQIPEFHELKNGLNENLMLTEINHNWDLAKNEVEINCRDNTVAKGDGFKYFIYESSYNTDFSFDLHSANNGLYFIVWKLKKSDDNAHIFKPKDGESSRKTIEYIRSIEKGVKGESKGLKESSTLKCEIYNLSPSHVYSGYLKDFRGNDQLKTGEKIIIGVYGEVNAKFDIIVHTVEQKTLVKNTECEGGKYLVDALRTEVATDAEVPTSQVSFYQDEQMSIPFGATEITNNQTIYAEVLDASGDLKYVYKVDLVFKPVYDFSTAIRPEAERQIESCATTIQMTDQQLINAILNVPNAADFAIVEKIDQVGNPITGSFPNDQTIKIKVEYKGTQFCSATSDWITLKFSNANPTFDAGAVFNKDLCEGSSLSREELRTLLKVATNHTLVVTGYAPGTPITFSGNNSFVFQVQLMDNADNSCVSVVENFTVNKTEPIDLESYALKTCAVDLEQKDIDDAIAFIRNGTSATLRYYEDGLEIEEDVLLSYITDKNNGVITVKGELNGHCETEVKWTYELTKSSISVTQPIQPLLSSCLSENEKFVVSQTELETYLSSTLGLSNVTYEFGSISFPINIEANQMQMVDFTIKKNGETCNTETLQVEVKAINQPDFDLSNLPELTADCDDSIKITNDWLRMNIGKDVLDYPIYINGKLHDENNSITIAFGTESTKTISIEIRNKTVQTCTIASTITINKAKEFSDDLSVTQAYFDENQVSFCENDSDTAIDQVKDLLAKIQENHPGVVFDQNALDLVQAMTSPAGKVKVTVRRHDECSSKDLFISYQKYTQPTIELPVFPALCSQGVFDFDIRTLVNYDEHLTYTITNDAGVEIYPKEDFIYQLSAGSSYTITAESGNACTSDVYSFTIETLPDPTIKSITIENGTLTVEAKGNGGRLQYAISYDGALPTQWQSSKKFQPIEGGKNITVWVRENECGGVSVSGIYVFDLPNFISPNGDGKNDVWKPLTSIDSPHILRLQIFDRYGQTILRKEGNAEIVYWDGKRNGTPIPSGDYWYIIDYPNVNNQNIQINIKYSGNITLKNK
ncbi:T9SS type B sorting domain-containing protein [Weeksella virosa]|uniref:T9SS type B sorting domain-containing protein n=1 Tax=Weeksella virosa TaxID=1014 RepID=UPI002553893E|nr:T9SS type B sorting domain-containing protein [Weeksella virosa]MDK7675982.1 T9SS type B sorting domain-containing protein [Weeksella virosa]